ncbi:uncharacterized protein LOC128866976 [Anastrepha ludens]|uniref:uncharacterized protein LOC128866976 n=1 Tax=Anastrepha ludens TaxID=28586 RepID=UPI0023B1DDE6|nr:uncharacterized protein LOC128866976 [Anastrepha ludens]
MPLVKLIGPKPTAADATAEAIAASQRRRLTVPEVAPETPERALLQRFTTTSEDSNLPLRLQVHEIEDDTPVGVRISRKTHGAFVVEVHAYALGYLLFALVQWTLIYEIHEIVDFVAAHYYLSLIPFMMSLVMLMCLLFFYDSIVRAWYEVLYYVYTVIMLQLATVAIAMPIGFSEFMHFVCSATFTAIVIIISMVIAFNRQDFNIFKPDFIYGWTCRCFILTSMGITVGTSLGSPYFVMVLSLTMSFFMSIYILICGKAISSAEFIWLDRLGPRMYGSLFYINYMTLYSVVVLFFEAFDDAKKLE